MTAHLCPLGRSGLRQKSPALGLAVAVLLASTLAACGRSGLIRLGAAELDAGPNGQTGGAAGGKTDGGAAGGGAGDASATDKPPATDGGPAVDADAGLDATMDAPGGKLPVALAVAPALLTLPVGGQGNFSATVTYPDGTTADVTSTSTWTSDATQVAAVKVGFVAALRPGTAHVTATLGALSARATVVVMSTISLVSIALDPPAATLPINGALTVAVIGTYSDGSTTDVTAMAKIGDDGSGVVFTDPMGDVTAKKAGVATVVASVGGLSTKMIIAVTAATVIDLAVLPPMGTAGIGTTFAFTADATLSDGTRADVTATAAWTIDDPNVAAIDVRGVVTGKVAGKTLVRAAFGGQSGLAVLVVTGAKLETLQIDPVDPNVGVGVELDFRATGLYSDGTKVDLTAQVAWGSSAPNVLPIDGVGRGFSKSVGTSVVTATQGGLVAASTVTVTAASLEKIAVSPSSATLSPGQSAALEALGTYSDGTVVDLTGSVTWTASPAGVVSASNASGTAGVATALRVGTSTVTATLGLVSGDAQIVVSPATLNAITISPASALVPIGATVALSANGTFSDGSTRDITADVAWASADDATATAANAPGVPGAVTGVAAGDVAVTATEAGIVGTAHVTVVAATLNAIAVSPADAMLTAGLRSSYTATGTYSDGNKLDLTAQVTWTTADSTIATVSNVAGAAGQVLARAVGSTTVTASLGAVTGQTSLTVVGSTASSLSIAPIAVATPLGTGVQYTATLVFTNGTTRNVTGQTAWTSSNPMVATIGRTGRAAPVAVGATTIGASYMGLAASTTLTVTDAVVTAVELTPIAPTVPVGTVTQFTATAIFSDASTRNVTPTATFVSSAPSVLGITTGGRNMRGRGTAVAAGSAVITVTYMGFTDATTVTVTDAVIVEISVSPLGLTLPVGARRQFTAQAIRSDGTSMAITGAATWLSDAPGVAAVSTAGATRGQVTGIGGGTANISATYMGVTGSVSLTVSPATLTLVQVTPFTPTISFNTALQFVATAIYSDGTNVAVTGMATWQSSDPIVAGISNAAGSRGRATSLGKGSTTISATFMNVTGTTTLSVTDATVTQIQVTPFAPTVPIGFERQLTATAVYSDGTNRDITSLATWTSGDAKTAAVSDALATKGLVDAVVAGKATITAQYAGVAGMTDVTVSAAVLKSLAITPAGPTVAVGAIQAFAATGTFDDGSTLDVTPLVTWTSSDLGVADVSNADGSRGQATAFDVGTTTIQAQRGAITATTTLTAN